MTETLSYIDSYFQNALDDTEKKVFERRCESDEAFAAEVAFYVASRQAIRDKLLEQKQAVWKQLHNSLTKNLPAAAPVRNLFVKKILPYAVAACLIIAVALVYLNSGNDPQQLADKYITKHFTQLPTMMGSEKDSIAIAIEAYNNKEYSKALSYFQSLHNSHTQESDYIKYPGLVYLMTNEYDKALQQFNELAGIKGLRSNPGQFLKAVTLLRRGKEGDEPEAKKLLRQVLNEKLEGSEDAAELMKEL